MISIIVVSYNTKTLLRDCLVSIFGSTVSVSYEVIVVDNNSTDGSQNMIREIFPQTILIENKHNVGFAKANNQAVKVSRYNYLLFLNSDTIIHHDAITQLYEHLKTDPGIGIAGPKILNPDHKPTRSYMRFLNVKMFFLGSKYFSDIIDTGKHQIHYANYDFTTTHDVQWLSGACFMIKRHVFEKAGCFDENYFFYCEDMDLCLQVSKLGYRSSYLPSAEIVHLFGGSSKSNQHEINHIYRKSLLYYFRKNFPITHYWIAKGYCAIRY